jgi:TLD
LQVEKWNDDRLEGASGQSDDAATGGTAPGPKLTSISSAGEIQHPVHLLPNLELIPAAAEASTIITPSEASAIAAALPGRRQMSEWQLRYATESGGFSLQSLYRAGAHCSRSILIIEDFSGYVFGAFCTDPWRVKPRYQGTGECFVFQIRPHAIKYAWLQRADVTGRLNGRNDFFMLLGTESAGFGGAPHFAIWLDSDLLYGNSGLCHTFASPTLSGSEDFKIKSLELWQIGA